MDENTTAVTTVAATDVDASATQTFSISGGADQALFSIDSSTGALAFVSAPNFEAPADAGANNVYDVQVQVSDGSLTDTQDIAVTVADVNEAPVITSDGGGDAAALTVDENTTAVTTVTATDVDASATQTFSISGGADQALFSIDSSTGALAFVSAPNFEAPADAGADNVYDVQVQVSDGSLTDTQDIAVTVTDANDAPVITSDGGGDAAALNVAENTTAVTTVTASDEDLGATQTFSISGGADQALFSIDASTGALAFVSAPNFEAPADAGANNVYDVQVQVSDGSLTDTQDIAVTVADVNEAPVAVDDSGSMTEDDASKLFDVRSNDTLDPDAGASNNVAVFEPTVGANGLGIDGSDLAVGVSGNQVNVHLLGTDWQKLAAGQTLDVTIPYGLFGNGVGDGSGATLTVTVTGVNDAPVAVDDSASTNEDTAVITGNVLANDSDVDNTLTPANISAFDATSANGGTVASNGDGTFTYTPAAELQRRRQLHLHHRRRRGWR